MFSLGGQDNYAFSPDGQEICYTSNHDKNQAASTNNDLWIVPVNGGAAKNITADNPASDSTPLYSPDGRYIAYRAQQRPGYESDRFRLDAVRPQDGGEEESDGEFRSLGRNIRLGAGLEDDLLQRRARRRHPLIYAVLEPIITGRAAISIRDLVGGYNDDRRSHSRRRRRLLFTRNVDRGSDRNLRSRRQRRRLSGKDRRR